MQSRILYERRWRILIAAVAAVGLFWARKWLWQAVTQLFWGMLLALAALPVMRRLEKRLPAGAAAGAAMLSLAAAVVGTLLLLAPPLVRQGKELAALLPSLYGAVEDVVLRGQNWLVRHGVRLDSGMQEAVLLKGQEFLGSAVPAVAGWLGGMAGGVGRWMLSPVFAYYFLRDRKNIGGWLMMLLPIESREVIVRILREMRRETAGYLRGQLLVSAIVGGVTAVGLLFCGIPAWLVLGVVMGVLELIPYVGPFAGGVVVALFALPGGLSRTLWALGVVLAVQQLEGSFLSPQLMSEATRLHPLAVILCVMLGGAAGGMAGILLAVPLLLCIRAALRVWSLHRLDASRT